LYEISETSGKIVSVDYRILNKYIADIDSQLPLEQQILKAYFAQTPNKFEEEKNDFCLEKYTLGPGKYYPRVYRPIENERIGLSNKCSDCPNKMSEIEKYYYQNIAKINEFASELRGLTSRFNEICRYIYPDIANYNTYSSEIRTLIILINTEIEAHMKAILFENGIQKEIYTTKDYFLLNKLLKLSYYSVRFKEYNKIPELRPFELWSDNNPTKSLSWMHAYNKIKHDKYSKMDEASYENLVLSYGALLIMEYAQFGNFENINKTLDPICCIIKPNWNLSERYFYDGEWNLVKFFNCGAT
jgi:hypothetical protein